MSRVCVEYIWIGGPVLKHSYTSPFSLRSKTKVMRLDESRDLTLDDLPIWNFDGSSTAQAETQASEVFLKPCAIYSDPFRGYPHKLALCETYLDHMATIPHSTNTRRPAELIFNQYQNQLPWYGLEQEFFLLRTSDHLPLGWDPKRPQGPYYCGVGNLNAYGRTYIEDMMNYALEAGLNISGINAEVAPGQWEIQVGPCLGIEAGDQLTVLRYIMERVTESSPVYIELHPKPLVSSDWNGSGTHTNFSTLAMREDHNLKTIHQAIDHLKDKHSEHIALSGAFNDLRLSGQCETSSMNTFSWGVSDRGASIRIPTEVANRGQGYLEDRRPSSLMDPYVVTSALLKTIN